MAAFTLYIKNIAYFLIFSAFVGIISPGKKYKNYVNLIMGLVMIFIVIEPAAGLIESLSSTGSITDIVTRSLNTQNITADASGISKYEDIQDQLIKKAYDDQVKNQLELLIVQDKHYTIVELDVEASTDYSSILSIGLAVKEASTKTAPKPFIRIEPINVSVTADNQYINIVSGETESVETSNLKKIISDFYNLSVNNIHIKVIS